MDPLLKFRKLKSSVHRRSAVLLASAVVGAVAAFVSGSPSVASTGQGLMPPGGVYTCAWIAEHPVEAAAAQVSCDPGMFTPTGKPTLARTYAFFSPFASGCHYQPFDGGWIGQGVFTWTSYKYTNWWQWYEERPVNYQDPNHDYTWYVQRTDGTSAAYDRVFDGAIHGTGVIGANNYRWGAQNHINDARRYYVCWDVR
jgi:hypothetical protein